MRLALDQAAEAGRLGEVPVGAIAVHDGRVVGRGANSPIRLSDPTAHAEILAIGAAGGQGDSWRLDGATLYVTLEPCTMCSGAILLSRVEQIVFGASDPRAGGVISTARLLDGNPYQHRIEVVGGILAEECGALLSAFFAQRRNR